MPEKSIAGLEERKHTFYELPMGATVVRNCGQPGVAENDHQLTAEREMRTSVIQLQGNEFCQQPVSSEKGSMRTKNCSPSRHLGFSPVRPQQSI